MRPRLSGTQAGTLVTEMRDAWVDPTDASPTVLAIMEAAEIDASHSTPTSDMLARLDAWMADGRGCGKIPVSDLVLSMPCVPRMFECMDGIGICPEALVRLADHNDGIARVDDADADRCGPMLVMDLRGFEVMVEIRLRDDIVWTGGELRLSGISIPDTVQADMIGRDAATIIDHPALVDLRVIDLEQVGTGTLVRVDAGRTCTLGDALAERIADQHRMR